jgi:CheY-like chemotaxis protein
VDDAAPGLIGVRVLLVDDNTDSLEVLGLALERAGAMVWAVASGPAAIASWEQEPADVLLCDLAMPGMDGFEVLRRIQALDAMSGRTTTSLAVTAYASEDYRARCIRAGFIGHLSKPYNLSDVVRAVAAAVAR